MTQSLNFPVKYHVVWLDAHIGEADFCLQLKRAFFTNVDASNNNAVGLWDVEIDNKIIFESEIPIQFDSFHFTLDAFKVEEPCLKYIDEIKKWSNFIHYLEHAWWISSGKVTASIPRLIH